MGIYGNFVLFSGYYGNLYEFIGIYGNFKGIYGNLYEQKLVKKLNLVLYNEFYL